MMQHDHPDDLVIGTGEAHSVGEFLEKHHGPWHNWDDQVISMGNNR